MLRLMVAAIFCLVLTTLHAEPTEFKHMVEIQKCELCHAPKHLDKLVLLDGTKVEHSDIPRLCGQCHGPKYRDWKLNLHGKQTGSWKGSADRWLCTKCHEAHSPKFKQMQASPMPNFPKLGIPKIEENHE